FRADRADVIYRYEKHEKKYLIDKGIVPKELLELAGT
ncbi:MAG: translation initiation factor IF-1A, partial [Desulfurococcaceae archaeon]